MTGSRSFPKGGDHVSVQLQTQSRRAGEGEVRTASTLQPGARRTRRNQGRMLHLLLTLRPASGEAITGCRSQGVSEKSHAVVSHTSATQQNKGTGAERSSVWKPTSLIRGVALAAPSLRKKCAVVSKSAPLSSLKW